MTEKYKRSQRCTVNAMNQLKKSLFMEYNLLYKKNLSFAAANRPGVDFKTNKFLARTA